MKKPVIALIDCNNFFVSCERIFRPDLAARPTVVLSSNDGCAVARSNEVKALGVPMGAPAFKYRELFEKHRIVKFSANFELYGDISRRITTLLSSITPKIEVYSVDESFLDITNLPIEDYDEWGRQVRALILEWIGVPVSIGIAHSKTLAKLASERAKKDDSLQGALGLVSVPLGWKNHHLQAVPVEDVWGVGRKLAPKLKSEGIFTALDLARMRPRHAQKRMGIHGRQMVAELNDMLCIPFTLEDKKPKSIMSTRTFGHDTNDLDSLQAALANFTATATFKLRTSNQLTTKASLFITTSKHKPNYRHWGSEVTFINPTADTGFLIATFAKEFNRLYKKNVLYHRAGITLYDFVPDAHLQTDVFGLLNANQHDATRQRMHAVDAINERFGRKTISFASQHLGQQWVPKRNVRSPRYTTKWSELAIL